MWQLNAYGFRAQIDTGLSLRDAQSVWVKIQRPDNTIIERAIASADITDPAGGIVSLPILQGDLTQVGWYHIQVIDRTPGRFLPSGILRFTVEKNL